MDKIKVEELKRDFPKTWEIINAEQNRYYILAKQVYIRRFLERNGYSISCKPLMYLPKAIPQIVYRGSEVGKEGFFLMDDFDPMTIAKAEKTGLMYALKDFEKRCYDLKLLDWD